MPGPVLPMTIGNTIWYYRRNRTTGVTGYSHLRGLDYSSGTVPL